MRAFYSHASVDVFVTSKYFLLYTRTLYGCAAMYNHPEKLLPVSCDNRLLGAQIRQALLESQPGKASDVFDAKECHLEYMNVIKDLMKREGYKRKKVFYKDLRNCHLHVHDDKIVIDGSQLATFPLWDGISEARLEFPLDASESALGAGLKTVASHCLTSVFTWMLDEERYHALLASQP